MLVKAISDFKTLISLAYRWFLAESCTWADLQPVFLLYCTACSFTCLVFYSCSTEESNRNHRSTFKLGNWLCAFQDPSTICTSLSMTSPPRPVIYIIGSVAHHHCYVGQTSNLLRRAREHFTTALRPGPKKQRVHRCLQQLGTHEFFIAPIAQLPLQANLPMMLQAETVLIRRLQPCLNVNTTRVTKRKGEAFARRARLSPRKRRRHGTSCGTVPDVFASKQCLIRERRFVESEFMQEEKTSRMRSIRSHSLAYLASRHKTAVTYLKIQTLGTAVPPTVAATIRQKCAQHKWLRVTRPQNDIVPFPFLPTLQSSQLSPVPVNDKSFLTVFQVKTHHGVYMTNNLPKCLQEYVLAAPPTPGFQHYTLTSAFIDIHHWGVMRIRLKMCTFQHRIWCPIVLMMCPGRKHPICVTTLKFGIRALEMGTATAIWLPFLSPALRIDPRLVVLLYDLVRLAKSTKWLLRDVDFEGVLTLYHRVNIIQNVHWRQSATGALLSHLRLRWNISPNRSLVCRMECIPAPSARSLLRRLAMVIVHSTTRPCSRLRHMLSSKLRVIISSAPSIRQTLCNHVKAARNFNRDLPPRCFCQELKDQFPLTETDGHFIRRGHTTLIPLLQHVFGVSAATTIRPVEVDIDRALYLTSLNFYNSLVRWLGNTRGNNQAFTMLIDVGEAATILPTWPRTWFHEISEIAITLGSPVSLIVWETIASVRQDLMGSIPQIHGDHVTMNHIRSARDVLGDAIICPLDRNMGELVVMCPTRLHIEFFKMFPALPKTKSVRFASTHTQSSASTPANRRTPVKPSLTVAQPQTYRLCSLLTSSTVLSSWKFRFKPFSHLGNLRAGEVPYAYVFPKHKDLSRYRPIVSYAQAPHRVILRSVARGLFFVLQDLPVPHFNLWSAFGVRSGLFHTLENLSQQCESRGFDNIDLRMLSLDIKDMYTALPHAAIRTAVTWCCSEYHRKRRRDRVSIAIRGKTDGRRGRTYDTAQRREILLAEMVDIADINLQESFFTAGDLIILQRVGIPMGCPLSPALAICVCIYAEAMLLLSRAVVERPIVGIRYFDDLLLFTIARCNQTGSPSQREMELADQTLGVHTTMYPATLRLIQQSSSPRCTEFLELIIQHCKGCVYTTYRNRNAATLLMGQPHQSIRRFLHGNSFTPAGQKRTTILGMLHRMASMESTPLGMVASALLLIFEFLSVGYSMKIILEALHRLARYHCLRKIWAFILKILKNVW